MPIDPISWAIIIGSFIAGASVGYFWDEITEWANRMLGYILDSINRAIEVTSDAAVYLVREGSRVYKKVEVYVRNIHTLVTSIKQREEEISPYDLPDEINEQLNRKTKLKLMQQQT
ncbi:MAG: hypothetical protein ACKPCI_25795 [Dolichospermum sp.]